MNTSIINKSLKCTSVVLFVIYKLGGKDSKDLVLKSIDLNTNQQRLMFKVLKICWSFDDDLAMILNDAALYSIYHVQIYEMLVGGWEEGWVDHCHAIISRSKIHCCCQYYKDPTIVFKMDNFKFSELFFLTRFKGNQFNIIISKPA